MAVTNLSQRTTNTTATSNEALKIALACFQAMANKDIDGIVTLVDDNIACFIPVGDLDRAARKPLHNRSVYA